MKLHILQPRKSLNKAYLKVKPVRSSIESFKANLIHLLDQVNEAETEEFHKTIVSRFLHATWYEGKHYINTKGRNDLVIHNGKDARSTVGVIIEAKKPANKAEMLRKDNINTKAFHELLLYYLRERITHKNLELKYIVATNIYEWFIFDAQLFERLFASDRKLVHQFTDFEEGRLAGKTTDFFYREIAEPAIAGVAHEVPFTWFDFRSYEKALRNTDQSDDNKLIALYKIFSPEHLLKLPFVNDSNSLNKSFYAELLHIIGLQERKDKNKKVIGRKAAKERDTGSLLENAISQLDSLDKISRLGKPSQYGENYDKRLFNVGLELCITWMNRILFLKLLEAQLINYHKGNKQFTFLNIEKVKNYDDLNTLFFSVLARLPDDRSEDVRHLFADVPYLNSSLFEPSEMEHQTLFISNLRDEHTLPVLGNSVLRKSDKFKKTTELNTLSYLFEFLNAYDFSSEGAEEIQEDNKVLINASVLGLIFEKINGYKDGSFFTPGFITMYMCRETIRQAVVQKFNTVKNWNCSGIDALYDKIDDRKEANEIINSLKICDPAVGSGHFLVSALNEIIAVKNDLNILSDRTGRRLKEYHVEVVNDELIVTDENGELFEYRPGNRESQRIQEALFHEKQTIIENCLFGVDINPNSVKICRLRLWIELLKNAYYKSDGQLETLPNIDINIKCGNSLISRFPLDADLRQALKKSKWGIDSYRLAVQQYRHANNKEEKRELERLINDIKYDFRTEISRNDKLVVQLNRKRGELTRLTTQQSLFDMSETEKKKWEKDVNELVVGIEKLEQEIEAIRNNKIFENAFEWRFEFPEVLDDDGDFVGFDMVIGNPPYIRQEEFSEHKGYLLQAYTETGNGIADLFVYFVELGLRILKPEGEFAFIIPNKWMRAGYGKKLRQFVANHKINYLIDFGDLPVFEEAITYPNIIQLKKSVPTNEFNACVVTTLQFENGLKSYLNENSIRVKVNELSPEGWTLSDSNVQALLSKIRSKGVALIEYVNGKVYYGIKTALNEAFVIDKETRDRLIAEDPKSAAVIKPFLAGRDIKRYQTPVSDRFLILFPKGFTIKRNLPKDDPNYLLAEPPPRYGNMPYDDAWDWVKANYPAIARHLFPFKAKAEKRTDQGDFWWELRACDYYEEFEKPKVMLPDISIRCEALLDELGGYYSVNTAYIIPGLTKSDLGILNSRLILFYYSNLTQTIRGGYFRFIRQYLAQIPIIKTDLLEELVTEIIEAKKQDPNADTSALENEIDQLVYELYGLTEEEISIIENPSWHSN